MINKYTPLQQLSKILAKHNPPAPIKALIDAINSDDILRVINFKYETDGIKTQYDVFHESFANNLLKKCVSLESEDLDPKHEAVSVFLAQEEFNLRTKEHLDSFFKYCRENRLSDASAKIIADRWSRELTYFFRTFRFCDVKPRITTGATSTVKSGSPIIKQIGLPITATLPMVEWLHSQGETNLNGLPTSMFTRLPYDDNHFQLSEGATLDVVPKTAKIGRVIVKGCSANIAYQCGIGDWIRQRLIDVYQLDITKAQGIHREMAAYGSLFENLATIDLSNASDSITRTLVKNLVPDFYNQVKPVIEEKISTPFTKDSYLPKYSQFELFLSAGNGFCFEFETVLFYTLIKACGTDMNFTSVYGDDMILPTGYAEKVIRSLQFFGFRPNKEKSFISGNFRESCGGDYLSNFSVRGAYVKTLPCERIHWVRIANSIRNVCYYRHGGNWVHPYYKGLWNSVIQQLKPDDRLFGPAYLGDLCINSEDESRYTLRERNGNHPEIKIYNLSLPKEAYLDLYHRSRSGKNLFSSDAILQSALLGMKTNFTLSYKTISGVLTLEGNKSNLILNTAHPSISTRGAIDKCFNPAWKVYRAHPDPMGDSVDSLFDYLKGRIGVDNPIFFHSVFLRERARKARKEKLIKLSSLLCSLASKKESWEKEQREKFSAVLPTHDYGDYNSL